MSLNLEKLLTIDKSGYTRILRLLDIIERTDEVIESFDEPKTASIVKQYIYQKKEFVEELEELLKRYEITLEYDSSF